MKLAKCFMQARLRSKLSLEPSDVFFQPGADMLGVGASGTVRIATWNGRSVAVKLINDKHRMQGEAMMLESLAHPNVVKLIGLGLVKDSQEGLLVLELMRTSLRNLINTRSETLDGGRQPPFEMYTAIDIMLQIAVAMRYFHEHGILHCDMKASNVLVNDEDLTSLGHVQIKVTDFGLSRNIGSKVPVSLQNAGTPGWMAPEFFERRQDVPYTQASDVFSFAVTCSEILTGEVPFKDVHPDGLYQKLVAGERPCLPDNNFPQYLKQYIGMCWANNPEERPSFDQICEMLRFCRGFYIRNRLGSATTLASVNEHDAWELASRLSFDYCLHADNGLKFSKELVYYPLIYAATEGRLRYDREDLVKAQVEAGRYYGDWVGSWQDWQKAVTLFARAADEGDPEALWRLGLCYELGIGTPEETEITRPVPLLYRMAIERGCVSGHVELGLCYALGTCGLPRDPEKAVQSWKAAKVEQLIRGECIPSISDMVRYVSTDRSLDSDTAVHARGRTMAGKRLRELTSEHSVARRLVAGPGNCNVGPLLQAGHDGRSLHQDLVITLHNLSQEKRIRSTFQKYKKDIEKRGTYWTLMGAISSGPSLLQQVCGCMSEAIYFLSFIVVLPMLLFLLLAFRASGIKIVVFLLIIAPLLYMFLLVVCFLCLLQDNNSNHQREESDDQKEDSGIQRLLEEPEEHIGLEETRTNQSETQEQNETERNGKVSSIQCLPPIFFFMLAVIFLFIQRKLGFVCFIISVLYMFGVGIYEEFVREPGPDSDSDDDQ